MLGVNPYSDYLDWAHKLANYISNEENQELRFEMRGGMVLLILRRHSQIKSKYHRQYRQLLHSQNFPNSRGLAAISGTLSLNLATRWQKATQAAKTSRTCLITLLRKSRLLL